MLGWDFVPLWVRPVQGLGGRGVVGSFKVVSVLWSAGVWVRRAPGGFRCGVAAGRDLWEALTSAGCEIRCEWGWCRWGGWLSQGRDFEIEGFGIDCTWGGVVFAVGAKGWVFGFVDRPGCGDWGSLRDSQGGGGRGGGSRGCGRGCEECGQAERWSVDGACRCRYSACGWGGVIAGAE